MASSTIDQLLAITAAPTKPETGTAPSAADFTAALDAAVGDDAHVPGPVDGRSSAQSTEPAAAERPSVDAAGNDDSSSHEDPEQDEIQRSTGEADEQPAEEVDGDDQLEVSAEAEAAVANIDEQIAKVVAAAAGGGTAEAEGNETTSDEDASRRRRGGNQKQRNQKAAAEQTPRPTDGQTHGQTENPAGATGRDVAAKEDEFIPLVGQRGAAAKTGRTEGNEQLGPPTAAASNAEANDVISRLPAELEIPRGEADVIANAIKGRSDGPDDQRSADDASRPVNPTAKTVAPTLSRVAAPRGVHPAATAAEQDTTPTIDRPRFVQRVSGAIDAAQRRDGRIQVRLSPPDLGSLRIELVVRQGTLTATLETETLAARQVLLDNLPALRARLAEQDIRVEQFDVDVGRDGRGGPDGGPDDRPSYSPDQRGDSKSTESGAAETGEPLTPDADETTLEQIDDNLDIRI